MQILPKQILWPTDFSSNASKGAAYARAFCESFGAMLHILHVAPIVPVIGSIGSAPGSEMLGSPIDMVEPAKESLQRLIAGDFSDLPGVRGQVLPGVAWDEICRYAEENGIDLIVLATHGLSGLRRLLIGSTAERVVQHATCPVLTVKSFEAGFLQPREKQDEARKSPRQEQAAGAGHRGPRKPGAGK
jgi:nucleotide-binding universal stress UspA family protein